MTILEVVKTNYFDGDTIIKTWTGGKTDIRNLVCNVDCRNYVTEAKEQFVCIPV